jgi:hypothetical protein
MNKTKFIIAFMIFCVFIVQSVHSMTTQGVHEWLGLAFAAVIVVHILLHWKWIVETGGHYFRDLWQVSRLKFVINIVFFITMTTLILSGVLISREVQGTLGIHLNAGRYWRQVHSLAANLALLVMAVHFALNWKWVSTMSKRFVFTPLTRPFIRRSKTSETS